MPVAKKDVCVHFLQLLEAIADSLGVYYNSTGQSKCYNLEQDATANLGDQGWSFQVTQQQYTQLCSN